VKLLLLMHQALPEHYAATTCGMQDPDGYWIEILNGKNSTKLV